MATEPKDPKNMRTPAETYDAIARGDLTRDEALQEAVQSVLEMPSRSGEIARLRLLESVVRKYVDAIDQEAVSFEEKIGALSPGEKGPVLDIDASEALLEEIRRLLADGETRRPD